jgi:hypothetical protein
VSEPEWATKPGALLLGRVFQIAVNVHGEQRDLAGEPYLFHVMRVAAAMDNDHERAAAILHDVLEDCPPMERLKLSHWILTFCGEGVFDAVIALSHEEGESYGGYIFRIADNPLAIKVKLADLADNSNPERLAKLPPDVRTRLEAKYASAKKILQEIQRSTKGETHEAQSHPRNDSAEPAGDSSNSPESFPEGTGGEAPNRNPSSGSY